MYNIILSGIFTSINIIQFETRRKCLTDVTKCIFTIINENLHSIECCLHSTCSLVVLAICSFVFVALLLHNAIFWSLKCFLAYFHVHFGNNNFLFDKMQLSFARKRQQVSCYWLTVLFTLITLDRLINWMRNVYNTLHIFEQLSCVAGVELSNLD